MGYQKQVRSLLKSKFVRSVSVVVGGTAVAQAVTMAFSPVLTRMYGTGGFGVLGVFVSAATILSSLATGGYSLAIALPQREEDAKNLSRLSLKITAVVSTIVLSLTLAFARPVAEILGEPALSSVLWLLSPFVALTGLQMVLTQWHIRTEQFRRLSVVSICQAVGLGGSKVGFGLVSPTGIALILVTTVAKGLHVVMLGGSIFRRSAFREVEERDRSPKPLRIVAKEYSDYPRYRAPQDFLNASSKYLPPVLLSGIFGISVGGLYTLAQRVLQLPITLIAKAVGKVILPKFARDTRDGRSLQRSIMNATGALALLGIVPFGVIVLFGPALFQWVFGAEWGTAGTYARWLAVWLFCVFVNVPAVQSLPFVRSQRLYLLWEVISSTGQLLCIVAISLIVGSDTLAVAAYSLYGAAANLFLIWVAVRRAGDPARMREIGS